MDAIGAAATWWRFSSDILPPDDAEGANIIPLDPRFGIDAMGVVDGRRRCKRASKPLYFIPMPRDGVGRGFPGYDAALGGDINLGERSPLLGFNTISQVRANRRGPGSLTVKAQ